jgi:hypothetical protein
MVSDGNVGRGILGAVAASLLYGVSFWRIYKGNRGNRIVEFGMLTIMVMLCFAFLLNVVDFPDWAFASIILLLFVLCMLTLFFVFQRAYHALRGRRHN